MRIQMIKARFAACIADSLQTVRADVSKWACASVPRRRSTGKLDHALLIIKLVPERGACLPKSKEWRQASMKFAQCAGIFPVPRPDEEEVK